MGKLHIKKQSLILMFSSMLIILFFSVQPGDISSVFSGLVTKIVDWVMNFISIETTESAGDGPSREFIIRKCAHVLMYSYLGIGVTSVMSDIFAKDTLSHIMWIILVSFIFCTLYGMGDELIQSHLIGRDGKLADVYVDAIGYSLGIAMIAVNRIKNMREIRQNVIKTYM